MCGVSMFLQMDHRERQTDRQTDTDRVRQRDRERQRFTTERNLVFTSNTAIHFFTKKKNETKFGCKKIIGSKNIVETVIFSLHEPHYDFDLEDNKPTLSHNTPACDNAPPYKGWLQKV